MTTGADRFGGFARGADRSCRRPVTQRDTGCIASPWLRAFVASGCRGKLCRRRRVSPPGPTRAARVCWLSIVWSRVHDSVHTQRVVRKARLRGPAACARWLRDAVCSRHGRHRKRHRRCSGHGPEYRWPARYGKRRRLLESAAPVTNPRQPGMRWPLPAGQISTNPPDHLAVQLSQIADAR